MFTKHSIKSLAVLAACMSFAAIASDGGLDPGFGVGGKLNFASGAYRFENGEVPVTTMSDGRIYLAARTHDALEATATLLVRRLADGSPDNSFGTAGFRSHTLVAGQSLLPYALAAQPDGKLLVGGRSAVINVVRASICRFNSTNGDLDTSFGQVGNPGCYFFNLLGGETHVTALRLQSDGKIVASIVDPGQMSPGYVLRLDANGLPDNGFGNAGIANVLQGPDIDVNDIALTSDGKIVAAGAIATGNTSAVLVARLNGTNGALDGTFNGSGIQSANFPLGMSNSASATSVAVLGDGSVIAAGTAQFNASSSVVALKVTSGGLIDLGFGPTLNGKVVTDFTGFNNVMKQLIVQCDGRLLLTGSVRPVNNTKPYDFAARRLIANGNLDPSFGTGGVTLVPFDLAGERDDMVTGAFLQGGRLMLAGTANLTPGMTDVFALARLDSDTIFCDGFE